MSGPFDTTMVASALPAPRQRFGTSMAAVQWVSLGYLLTVTAARRRRWARRRSWRASPR